MEFLIVIVVYLVAVNVVAFLLFGIDKWKARHARWRISETTLFGMALMGGGLGAWLGMRVWHHKTLHRLFRYGIPFLLILHLSLFVFLYSSTCFS